MAVRTPIKRTLQGFRFMPEAQNFSVGPAGQLKGSPETLAKNLIQVLTAQRDLYVQLADLARQQSEFVATGESESLMTVLGARNHLIDQLATLDRQLQPYKGRWQEILDTFAPDDRTTAGNLLRQVQQLLADILERDEADKQSLDRQKRGIQAELNQAVRGTQLNKAYGIRPKTQPRGLIG